MTSLHVICGLGPPPIKNPGYAYASEMLYTFSIDAYIRICFEPLIPRLHPGCHVIERLKSTGEVLRETVTVLVVKQVSSN